MNFDYLKEKKELVLIALLGVSLLLAVLILVKITGFFTDSARAENLVKKAVEQNNTDDGDTDKYFAKYKLLAEALKKNNLFAPPPPKQHPVKEVPAIFGNEVLINNKWYKAGDMVEDAKIIAIEPTNVKIEWDGRVKVFAPISGSTEASKRLSPNTRMARTTRKEIRTGEATMVVVGSEGRGQRGTGGSGNLSEKERAKLQRKAEQKKKSPTEKEKSNKLSKRDMEKEQAKRKKDIAQKTKRNSNSKPKKETTQRKIKK